MDQDGNLLLPEEWGAHRSLNELIEDEWKLRVLVRDMRKSLDAARDHLADNESASIVIWNAQAEMLIERAASLLGAPHD